jgi:hypothetical protein
MHVMVKGLEYRREYNGCCGTVIRQSHCLKWIVEVKVKKEADEKVGSRDRTPEPDQKLASKNKCDNFVLLMLCGENIAAPSAYPGYDQDLLPTDDKEIQKRYGSEATLHCTIQSSPSESKESIARRLSSSRPDIARIKSRELEILRELAEAREKGFKLVADKAETKLSEHYVNSKLLRNGWCGLGLKLSAAAPYRVLNPRPSLVGATDNDKDAGDTGPEFDVILQVEGIDLERLKLHEVCICQKRGLIYIRNACIALKLMCSDMCKRRAGANADQGATRFSPLSHRGLCTLK